jgi:predicted esterase
VKLTSHSIEARTHGRYVVQHPSGPAAGLLVGFHGYAETAELHLARLKGVPGAERWRLVSIQGLHRFYRRRSGDVVASWMTREDRELAIADNLAYVTAVIEAVTASSVEHERVVFAGFSQGVAAAVRTACSLQQIGLILLGGEVPPELGRPSLAQVGDVLLGRGERDETLPEAIWKRDVARFQEAGVEIEAFTFDVGHEWTDAFSAAAGGFLSRRLQLGIHH